VLCIAIAGAVLASTAWHGGEVVYRYGIGVISLPKVEGDGHDHAHGAADQNTQESHDNHAASSDADSGNTNTMPADDGHDHSH
ncbi:MAG: hypothetical protein JKY90_01690, partial [Gammaproteobacteria bacterium]|nr:hypothetical protein [Gammaproteobacteria bacterium]